jgi:Protein of unknown function (DUF3604)
MDSFKKYLIDLQSVLETVDKISPYHYYQNRYFKLRQKWRTALNNWTRRTPCDVKAEFDKDYFIAGNRDSFILTYTIGDTPLKPGARIALYFPLLFGGIGQNNAPGTFQGPDGRAGYGSRITAEATKSGISFQMNVHSTGAVFTCVEVLLEKGCLKKGDQLKIIIGDTSCCKQPIISEKAQTLTFRTAVDFKGDGEFHPVKPDICLKGRGNNARFLNCYVPPTSKVNEKFNMKVVAADIHNGNPSYNYSGEIKISPKGVPINYPDKFIAEESSHGTFDISGFSIKNKNGVSRITLIDEENAVMGISNPICPEATPEGLTLYYGEIHAHTELSDGVGSPEDAMRWARDVEGLDFSALADHFEGSQSYNYTRDEKWKSSRDIVNKYNTPGQFVALQGYEIGTVEAHRNVYFPDAEGRMIVNDDNGEIVTMDNVYDKLKGLDYILIPHAPKFHGINWYAQHKPERQRLVEICSAWGVSEEGGPLSVQESLNLGLKLGFTGGTDNHSAEPGHAGFPGLGGLTGVFAKDLTRRSIFDALMARRTFATNGARMIINFTVNDALMGQEIKLSQNREIFIKGRVISNAPIKKIDIIRNGKVIYSVVPSKKSDDMTIEWNDPENPENNIFNRELTGENTLYYYLRVRTVNMDLGWSSPIWINKL